MGTPAPTHHTWDAETAKGRFMLGAQEEHERQQAIKECKSLAAYKAMIHSDTNSVHGDKVDALNDMDFAFLKATAEVFCAEYSHLLDAANNPLWKEAYAQCLLEYRVNERGDHELVTDLDAWRSNMRQAVLANAEKSATWGAYRAQLKTRIIEILSKPHLAVAQGAEWVAKKADEAMRSAENAVWNLGMQGVWASRGVQRINNLSYETPEKIKDAANETNKGNPNFPLSPAFIKTRLRRQQIRYMTLKTKDGNNVFTFWDGSQIASLRGKHFNNARTFARFSRNILREINDADKVKYIDPEVFSKIHANQFTEDFRVSEITKDQTQGITGNQLSKILAISKSKLGEADTLDQKLKFPGDVSAKALTHLSKAEFDQFCNSYGSEMTVKQINGLRPGPRMLGARTYERIYGTPQVQIIRADNLKKIIENNGGFSGTKNDPDKPAMDPKVIRSLLPKQYASFIPSDAKFFNDLTGPQLRSMNPKAFQVMSADLLRAFDPGVVGQLTLKQMKEFERRCALQGPTPEQQNAINAYKNQSWSRWALQQTVISISGLRSIYRMTPQDVRNAKDDTKSKLYASNIPKISGLRMALILRYNPSAIQALEGSQVKSIQSVHFNTIFTKGTEGTEGTEGTKGTLVQTLKPGQFADVDPKVFGKIWSSRTKLMTADSTDADGQPVLGQISYLKNTHMMELTASRFPNRRPFIWFDRNPLNKWSKGQIQSISATTDNPAVQGIPINVIKRTKPECMSLFSAKQYDAFEHDQFRAIRTKAFSMIPGKELFNMQPEQFAQARFAQVASVTGKQIDDMIASTNADPANYKKLAKIIGALANKPPVKFARRPGTYFTIRPGKYNILEVMDPKTIAHIPLAVYKEKDMQTALGKFSVKQLEEFVKQWCVGTPSKLAELAQSSKDADKVMAQNIATAINMRRLVKMSGKLYKNMDPAVFGLFSGTQVNGMRVKSRLGYPRALGKMSAQQFTGLDEKVKSIAPKSFARLPPKFIAALDPVTQMPKLTEQQLQKTKFAQLQSLEQILGKVGSDRKVQGGLTTQQLVQLKPGKAQELNARLPDLINKERQWITQQVFKVHPSLDAQQLILIVDQEMHTRYPRLAEVQNTLNAGQNYQQRFSEKTRLERAAIVAKEVIKSPVTAIKAVANAGALVHNLAKADNNAVRKDSLTPQEMALKDFFKGRKISRANLKLMAQQIPDFILQNKNATQMNTDITELLTAHKENPGMPDPASAKTHVNPVAFCGSAFAQCKMVEEACKAAKITENKDILTIYRMHQIRSELPLQHVISYVQKEQPVAISSDSAFVAAVLAAARANTGQRVKAINKALKARVPLTLVYQNDELKAAMEIRAAQLAEQERSSATNSSRLTPGGPSPR